MSYWQKINPAGAIADFRAVFRDAGVKRWPIAIVAASITVGIFSIMAAESWKKPRPLPEVTYINSWPLDRTEEETRAFIETNQKKKDEQQARIEAYEAEGRELWATLGRASGMDVDKIKREAEAERAAAKAAEKAKAEALLKQAGVEPVAE
ncbi:MAG: hypothetical protein ACK4YM_09075 [Novosphingobium sp.]